MTQTTEPTASVESRTASRPALEPSGELASVLMTRVNCMVGRRLASPLFRNAIRALMAAETECAGLRDRACDELYALGGEQCRLDRGALLKLRRAIYNNRPVEALPDGTEALPAVAAWFAAHQRAELAATALEHGHAAFLEQERVALVELLNNENFRQSLALNSPTVLDAVNRYRRAAGDLSARDRKSERGIIQHVARALVRVSPLSRFTAVGFATLVPAAPGVPGLDQHELSRRQGRSRVRPDRTLLVNAVSGIATELPTDTAPERLRLNPSLRVNGDRITFHHWANGRRRSLEVLLTAELRLLLGLAGMGAVDTDLLDETLRAVSGMSAEASAALIGTACKTQCLVPAAAYDERLDNPFPAAEAVLAEHPEARALVTGLAADFAVVQTGSVTDRVSALSRIKASELALNKLTSCPARVHVNEDSMLEPAAVSAAGYEQALTDLRAVTEFHRLNDRHHVIRGVLLRAFTDRHGSGATVNLLAVADELTAAVYDRLARLRVGNAEQLGPADGSVRELLALRASVDNEIHGQVKDANPNSDLQLDPSRLVAASRLLPDRFHGPSSYGMLVQPVDGRLVLNGCYNGHGMIGTRFLHADAEEPAGGVGAAAALRERIERLYGAPGVRLLEDAGLHAANINHHLSILPDQCGPDRWLGLRLHHDIATDRLQLLDTDGTEVRIFALGMKWLELQPSPLRIAAWLHDSGRVAIDPVAQVHSRLADWGPGTGSTVAYPRLTVGQVVLQRRRWYPGGDFPVRGGSDEAGQLLEIIRWRAQHDVPEEVVAKTHFGVPSVMADRSELGTMLRSRRQEKPQYLDLASALMVRVLPRLMERRTAGFLEEALPGVRAGWQALEWAIDVDFPAARA